MEKPKMILAIEAAVSGGSLSLVANGTEIANWTGEADGLRAENLIIEIERLLDFAGVAKTDINQLVVSAGPGSFTGIRIGMATGLGLKDALRISMVSVSALEAMAFSNNHTGIVAVPMGRGGAAAQRFVNGQAEGSPFSITTDEIYRLDPGDDLLNHGKLALVTDKRSGTTNFGKNVAFALAKLASAKPETLHEPIFLSKTT